LGHTGGTLDKLESIPGFRTGLSVREFRAQLARIGVAMIGQTETLAPADRKLYALRDVTGTVESIPLICASIMSKKLAEGIDALVLDVKFGSGAFMKTQARAQELAEAMVAAGRAAGKSVRALLTSMDEPLGFAAGNAVEIVESLECLKGRGPTDLMEVTLELGAHMLRFADVARDETEARRTLERALASGAALERMQSMIEAQGGDPRVADDYDRLPQAKLRREVRAPAGSGGFVAAVDALAIGRAVLALGGGRSAVDTVIDPAVGVTSLIKTGAAVEPGAPLAVLHGNDEDRLSQAEDWVRSALRFSPGKPAVATRLAGVVG
jgi:pyrimidine-nucleoside phosphorylase